MGGQKWRNCADFEAEPSAATTGVAAIVTTKAARSAVTARRQGIDRCIFLTSSRIAASEGRSGPKRAGHRRATAG
jgi:hypothetical protein